MTTDFYDKLLTTHRSISIQYYPLCNNYVLLVKCCYSKALIRSPYYLTTIYCVALLLVTD